MMPPITANSLANQRQQHHRRRRNRILLTLGLLFITASYCLHNPAHAQDDDTDLGQLSVNPYAPDSTSNPYSAAGSPYSASSVRNPYGEYGSPYSNQSATNPYATDAPKLYDADGNYRGKLSTNPYDPDSVSNPYGRYGSEYSADSINNPYGAGSEYRSDSPNNPHGVGMKIVAGGESDNATRATAPSAATKPSRPAAIKPLPVFGDESSAIDTED